MSVRYNTHLPPHPPFQVIPPSFQHGPRHLVLTRTFKRGARRGYHKEKITNSQLSQNKVKCLKYFCNWLLSVIFLASKKQNQNLYCLSKSRSLLHSSQPSILLVAYMKKIKHRTGSKRWSLIVITGQSFEDVEEKENSSVTASRYFFRPEKSVRILEGPHLQIAVIIISKYSSFSMVVCLGIFHNEKCNRKENVLSQNRRNNVGQ